METNERLQLATPDSLLAAVFIKGGGTRVQTVKQIVLRYSSGEVRRRIMGDLK